MTKIKKTAVESADRFLINNKLWGYTDYRGEVYSQVSYDDEGFNVKFSVFEADPKRTKANHLEHVHLDSCVEFFVNFDPENSNMYINFEVNANGVMNASFRSSREDSQKLLVSEIEEFNITPQIEKDFWTLQYKIGFSFIKKYYPDFDIKKCEYIKCNFYKCGDETEVMHFLSHFIVGTETPDFHRPEYFGKVEVE